MFFLFSYIVRIPLTFQITNKLIITTTRVAVNNFESLIFLQSHSESVLLSLSHEDTSHFVMAEPLVSGKFRQKLKWFMSIIQRTSKEICLCIDGERTWGSAQMILRFTPKDRSSSYTYRVVKYDRDTKNNVILSVANKDESGGSHILFTPYNEQILIIKGNTKWIKQYFMHSTYVLSKIRFASDITHTSCQISSPLIHPIQELHQEMQQMFAEMNMMNESGFDDKLSQQLIEASSAAYTSAKSLQKRNTSQDFDIISIQIECLIVKAQCQFQLMRYNGCLCTVRKGRKYKTTLNANVRFTDVVTNVNTVLQQYALRYDMIRNKLYHSDNKYSFYSDGHKLLKLTNNETLAQKLARKRIKRCVICHKLNQNKKCSRCQVIFYCSKKCQKIHWSDHRLTCALLNC